IQLLEPPRKRNLGELNIFSILSGAVHPHRHHLPSGLDQSSLENSRVLLDQSGSFWDRPRPIRELLDRLDQSGAFGSSSTNQGLFGQGVFASGDSSTSIFGGGSGGFSISDSADTTTTAAGLFGSPTPTSTFGAGASPLSSFGGSATKTNLFGAGAGAFGGGTFGGSPQASPGPSAAGQGIGSPASPPSGLFGRPVTTATGASTQGQTTPQIGGRSLFGAAAATPQQQEGSRSTVYTPLDQLTEEEKAQFRAPAFTLGKVPMRPPPREYIMDNVQ
ncbi:nuclear pore complex protein Nup98-Nup96-like, partial [Gigantopelta aegis]|uniref:nuclear pore complex protein Nup98-Nup96-like n=1 Tax=Gigantopelta aegis TaxID=1735272 RepID=UPI001B88D7D5